MIPLNSEKQYIYMYRGRMGRRRMIMKRRRRRRPEWRLL
jgi:hypothetical protein